MPPKDQVIVTPKRRNFGKIILIAGIAVFAISFIAIAINFLRPRIAGTGEITWWGLWEDQAVVQPLIDEYQNQHSGVKIKYVFQSPQDYRERLTSAIAKGAAPDIFSFHNSWAPMFSGELDSLPASVMSPADFAKTFYPVAASDLTVGSSIVGIPLEYDALSLFINQDIFSKAGKSPPTTWDGLRSLAKELTIKSEDGRIIQSGVALGRTENVDHWPEILALLMLQNGVDLSKPTGKPAEDALTYFTLISKEDGVWDASLPPSTQAFAGGKLAMYFGPSWRAFEIMSINKDLKFITVPVPQLPKDNPKQPDITYATYWAQGVWARSTKKAVAWDFLKFLSTKDSLEKLYQNESKTRAFGEPYSRVDMADLLSKDPFLGPVISQAQGAVSWYLDSRTFDGETGINSQIVKYFQDAVNAVADDKSSPTEALSTAAQGVRQVLSQYKLVGR